MDDFKKRMQGRQLLLLCGFIGACSAVMLSRIFRKVPSASDYSYDFINGFQIGILIALLGFIALYFIRNVFAVKNPERLKKLYIFETDERNLFIMQKSGSVGMNFVMYGLAVGTAVAGNFNITIFFTLFGACLFVALVRCLLKLYYCRKY